MIAIAKSTNLEPTRLPLITNYPSFRKWNKSFLDENLAAKPMCIYVHIPFCTQRCSFCYYKTVDLKEYRPEVDSYIDTLCKEFEMAAERFNLSDRPIHAVYFGGGTPSLLVEHQFEKLVTALRKNFKHFDDKVQFSLEAEPLTISKSKMDTLADLGVTRLSMGVQSFEDEIIKLSGRGHDAKKAFHAIETAQKAGQGQWTINIDLLSGLAGETDETWASSVKQAIGTGVESITVYKMEAFANTDVFQQGVRQEKINLPDEEQEMRFMQYAMDRFAEVNYLPWSFFTYTKDGCDESKYISSIWRGMDFYGFGASAFGTLGDSILQNASELDQYAAIIEQGELPLQRGYHFHSFDRMLREVLMGVKLLRFDLKGFKHRHGLKLEKICAPIINELEAEGFITLTKETLELTNKGILYGDYVGKTITDALKAFA